MKTSPHRIAAVAALGLLLAGIGAWQWRGADRKFAAPQANERSLRYPADQSPQGTVIADEREDPNGNERISPAVEACDQALRVQWKAGWEALGKRSDLESRITHALLAASMGPVDADGEDSNTTVALFEAASKAAPRDTEAAWYYARYCTNDDDCDGGAAVANLLALEPDNLDGWLLALQLAERDGDAAGVANALEGGAKAGYYDARTGESFTRLNRALRGFPLPPACATAEFKAVWEEANQAVHSPTADDLAIVHAIALASGELRAYSPLRDACGVEEIERMGRRRGDACRAILTRLADGDQLIDRVIGEMSMIELTTDMAQGAQWRERYRNTRWMMENASLLNSSAVEAARRWSEGEVAAMQAEFAVQGRWPPPADWLPNDERARSLIQTGRPPPETRR